MKNFAKQLIAVELVVGNSITTPLSPNMYGDLMLILDSYIELGGFIATHTWIYEKIDSPNYAGPYALHDAVMKGEFDIGGFDNIELNGVRYSYQLHEAMMDIFNEDDTIDFSGSYSVPDYILHEFDHNGHPLDYWDGWETYYKFLPQNCMKIARRCDGVSTLSGKEYEYFPAPFERVEYILPYYPLGVTSQYSSIRYFLSGEYFKNCTGALPGSYDAFVDDMNIPF